MRSFLVKRWYVLFNIQRHLRLVSKEAGSAYDRSILHRIRPLGFERLTFLRVRLHVCSLFCSIFVLNIFQMTYFFPPWYSKKHRGRANTNKQHLLKHLRHYF